MNGIVHVICTGHMHTIERMSKGQRTVIRINARGTTIPRCTEPYTCYTAMFTQYFRMQMHAYRDIEADFFGKNSINDLVIGIWSILRLCIHADYLFLAPTKNKRTRRTTSRNLSRNSRDVYTKNGFYVPSHIADRLHSCAGYFCRVSCVA